MHDDRVHDRIVYCIAGTDFGVACVAARVAMKFFEFFDRRLRKRETPERREKARADLGRKFRARAKFLYLRHLGQQQLVEGQAVFTGQVWQQVSRTESLRVNDLLKATGELVRDRYFETMDEGLPGEFRATAKGVRAAELAAGGHLGELAVMLGEADLSVVLREEFAQPTQTTALP